MDSVSQRLRKVLAGAVGTLALAALAGPAQAMAAGQQVDFDVGGQQCGPLTGTVTITGYNQNGQYSRWVGRSGDGHSVYARNWWWRGRVHVYWRGGVVSGYVTDSHDVSQGNYPNVVFVGCHGTRYFPAWRRFDNIGGKVYLVVSPWYLYDPLFKRYVVRSLTLGYWDGHYVYKVDDHIGFDINSGELVVAGSRDHWVVLQGAGEGAETCHAATHGLNWGPWEWVEAPLIAWCGAAGAIGSFTS